MENTIIIMTYFFSLMKAIEDDMTRNCSREDLDLILESMLFVTELLTTGTHYLQVALFAILLTLSRSISCLNWSRKLYSFYR